MQSVSKVNTYVLRVGFSSFHNGTHHDLEPSGERPIFSSLVVLSALRVILPVELIIIYQKTVPEPRVQD